MFALGGVPLGVGASGDPFLGTFLWKVIIRVCACSCLRVVLPFLEEHLRPRFRVSWRTGRRRSDSPIGAHTRTREMYGLSGVSCWSLNSKKFHQYGYVSSKASCGDGDWEVFGLPYPLPFGVAVSLSSDTFFLSSARQKTASPR